MATPRIIDVQYLVRYQHAQEGYATLKIKDGDLVPASPGLDHIKDLEKTASSKDLTAGNYMVVDTPEGAKKLPADLISGGTVTWDSIKDKPSAFSPSPHEHPMSDIPGLSDTITGLTTDVTSTQSSLDLHTSDTSNPHEVTAAQVGAYTKAETEEVINLAISGEVGGWLGNMTVEEINALTGQKKGDSVTVKDSGIVDSGHVTVSTGDDLMWVASKSVWEKKIVRDKGFVEFEGELRFG